LPIDRNLIARVRSLIIDVIFRRRQRLRQLLHRIILPPGIRTAGQQSRSRLGILVRSARPVARVR